MTFDIEMHIDSQSPEGHVLEAIVAREHVSPEQAILNLLKMFGQTEDGNYDHLFTPEVLATIDSATIEAKTGNNITMDEVRNNLKTRRNAWLANHPA